MNHVKITHSTGRGKSGRQYVYIRPVFKCFNRSRRCRVDQIEAVIEKHFPIVNYYRIDGHVIGAKNEEFALKEYWRVCEKSKVKKRFIVEPLECEHPAEAQKTYQAGGMYCADCGASEV